MYENLLLIEEKNLWLHSVGRIRVLETKLLSSEMLNRMIEADTFEDSLRILGENFNYQKSIQELSDSSKWEVVLNRHFLETISLIDRIAQGSQGVRVIKFYWDIHNLKTIFKAHITGQDIKYGTLDAGNFTCEQVHNLVKEEKTGEQYKISLSPILKKGRSVFEKTKNMQLVDMAMDKEGMESIVSMLFEDEQQFLYTYFRFRIDILNLKIFLRIKNLKKGVEFLNIGLIDGGFINKKIYTEIFEEPLVVLWTKLIKTHLSYLARTELEERSLTEVIEQVEKAEISLRKNFSYIAKRITFGFPVIAGYFFSKEDEFITLRTILSGKANALSSDIIRQGVWTIG
jgi:V/A-type H+-transporting ATPase subunit C